MVSRPFTDLKYMYFCGNGSKFEFLENDLVWAHVVTNLCVNEYVLPILKVTLTSPATPMFCLLAIFTVTELWVNLPKSSNVATVSMFMQLISAPESNKHEKTKPPVSILNLVPHTEPLLIVNICEESLPQFKYSLGLYLVNLCHFLKFWESTCQLPV